MTEFVYNRRVKTPMGNGLIAGTILRKCLEIIVSLDEKPIAAFDKGTNPLLVWSFHPKDVEVLDEE